MRCVLALCLLLCACSDGTWAGEVREVQAEVDRHVAAGELEEAEALLRGLSEGERTGAASAEQARALRQDAYYQRARLALGANPGRAERLADRGLALGGDDVFVANLYVVRGQAREALDKADDAAADYHEALLINERLLDAVLGESGEQ